MALVSPRSRGTLRGAALAGSIAGLCALGGCAQRIIRIESDPSGALVHLNDREVGRTPVEVEFTYFGIYDVRLTKDGYQPLMTSAEAETPVHELPVIDIFAGLFLQPTTRVEWSFDLSPAETDADAVIDRARRLRSQVGADEAAPLEAREPGEPIRVEGEEPEEVTEDPEEDLPPLLPDEGVPDRPPPG